MGSVGNYNSLSSDDEAYLYALRLFSFSALPMTLQAASDLNILDVIAEAGDGAYLSPSEIASKLPASNPHAAVMVDRMLRLLAAYDVVSIINVTTGDGGRVERRYGSAPVTRYLCKNEDGCSLAALGRFINSETLTKCWFYLKDAVMDGGVPPFTRAHGKHVFQYAQIDPQFNTILNDAMKNYSAIVMKKIVEVYSGFDDVTVLVDVGGCTGATLGAILAKHPHVRGINFDLPHVIMQAQVLPGVEHVGGDMFMEVPNGDAILMKLILHDWDDEHCVKLLKNCWRALPDNGKVIIIDGNLPISAKPNSTEKYVLHLDLLMLAHSPRGKERTEEEFEALAKVAGFSRFKKACTCADLYVMEFFK